MTLEGRVAGPWAAELDRVWLEAAPQIGNKTLSINLQNVTYVDAPGKEILRNIYAATHARLVAHSPWAQYLVEEITQSQANAC